MSLPVMVRGRAAAPHRRLSLRQALIAVVAAAVTGATAAMLGPLVLVLPLALGILWLAARWPASLFALFLYLGVFKAEPFVQGAPVDATAIIAIVLVVACGYRWLSEGTVRVPPLLLGLLSALGLWMSLSLLWTPAPAYGLQKVGLFLTLTSLATFAPFFLVRTVTDLRAFLLSVVALALLSGGIVVFGGAPATEGRLTFGESGDTISSARLLCAGALVLIFLQARTVAARVRLRSAATALVLLALGTGTRGAAIPFLAAALLTQLSQSRRRGEAMLAAAAGMLCLALVVLTLPLPTVAVERISDVFDDPLAALSEDTRRSFYTEAVGLIAEHPLRGAGIGGFSTLSYRLSDPAAVYPHNIFLEFASELGALATALVLVAFLALLWRMIRTVRSSMSDYGGMLVAVAGLLAFSLLAAQFSADINGNRALWGFLGLSWLLIRQPLAAEAGEKSTGGRPLSSSDAEAKLRPPRHATSRGLPTAAP